MLLYADDLELLAERTDSHCPQLLLSDALGYPFKWSKTRGGYQVEWLGMETEYSSYRLGLTKKRARWLVTSKEMAQGLGRLGFVAISLDWERPFLGPLYAWSSAIQGRQGPMTIPTMLSVR